MTIASKEEALDLFEMTRAEYLAKARKTALGLFKGKPITVNDVREVCPPPKGMDGRVMGAIFRTDDWVMIGYTPSLRAHKRPIAQFVRAGGVGAAE